MFHIMHNFATSVEEGCGIETLQAVLLASACLLYARRSMRTKIDRLAFLVYGGLSLLMLSCLFREQSFTALSDSAIFSVAKLCLYGLSFLLWMIWLAVALPHYRKILRSIHIILCLPAVKLTMLGILIYCLGWPFDKHFFNIPSKESQWIEESIELFATGVFFVGSLQHDAKGKEE